MNSVFFFPSTLFILLLTAQDGFMDGGGGGGGRVEKGSGSGMSDLLSPLLPVVQLIGPRNFVALGGNNLTIRYRLSPSAYNLSMPFASLLSPSFQLFWLPQDGPEKFLASQQPRSSVLSLAWQEVIFDCGLIVRGGHYNVRLVQEREGKELEDESVMMMMMMNNDNIPGGEIISNVTIQVDYPVIDFEVPHRLESYTRYNPSVSVSFGLTRSLCKPKLPLPSTRMTLSMCSRNDVDICSRNFLTLLRDPLQRLQSEGRVKVDVDCHFWGKNTTYRIQIEDSLTGLVFAKSQPIRVEWSPRFSLNLTVSSVLPCPSGKFIRVLVGYPECILPERDKVRLYGYDTPVPSLLAIKRLNYIGEKQIGRNEQILQFSCNLFTPRFSRYCFQYISTAVDDSVSVVLERCISTFSPVKFVDGGWGPWSEWSPCSSSCGPRQGKQFRYRFCDSPQPAFGANFCQGDSIEERVCDSSRSECLLSSSEEEDGVVEQPGKNEEEMNGHRAVQPGAGVAVETLHSFGFIPLHASLNMNLSTTLGCECGCILDNIQPGINYSLVVIISSNQSSCGDQDEEDHHHLKWILNGKDPRSRIRMDIVDVDLHCMKLAFRDGNTSDSNLLDVFTSSVVSSTSSSSSSSSMMPSRGLDGRLEEEIVEREQDGGEGEEEDVLRGDGEEDEGHEGMTIRVESTGASLSIAAADSNQHDCTFQFLYLVAYYQATPPHVLPEKSHHISDWIAYDFWTFLLLKLVLSFFVVALLCSTFGGCATKVYHKYKYSQLKWSENEVDEDGALMGSDGGDCHCQEPAGPTGDVSSRCTSVTLMSFDYSYWKRLRILRLKYFLLKPKPLNRKTAQVKSYPSTPTHNSKNNSCKGTKGTETLCAIASERVSEMMSKRQSLSESQLLQQRPNNNKLVTSYQDERKVHEPDCPQSCSDIRPELDDEDEVTEWSASHYIVQDVSKKVKKREGAQDDGEKYKLITCLPADKTSLNKGKVLASRKGPRPAFISVTIPSTEDPVLNDKIRKEQENLKRREAEEEGCGKSKKKKFAKKLQQNNYNCQQAPEEVAMKLILQHRDKGKSQISVATIQSLARLSSTTSDSQERVDIDDADHDFEMDYYDYDVLNAGNIPGSYLGLEPAFVLWNSEMYADDGREDGGDENEQDSSFIQHPLLLSASPSGLNGSSETFSISKSPSSYSSLQRGDGGGRHDRTRETSLQTLKFADDDDEFDHDDDHHPGPSSTQTSPLLEGQQEEQRSSYPV